MKVCIVFSLIIGVSMARPSGVVVAPLAIGVPVSSQYHAQDVLGQYSYGYSTGTSAKIEQKTLDGLTSGGYSYLDPNGLVQSVQYTSDLANGFRVAATNLPVGPKPVEDTPEVAAAKTKHLEAVSSRQAVAPVVPLAAPKPVEDTPEVAAAKVKHFAAVEEAKARVAVPVALPELSVVSINPAAVNSLVTLPAAIATLTAVPSPLVTAVSRLAPVPAAVTPLTVAPAVATPLAATPADVTRLAPVPAAASPLAAVPEAVARMAPAPVSPKTSAAATVPTSALTPAPAAVAPVAYSFEAPVPYFYSVNSPSYSFSVGAPILGYSALAPLQLAAPVATAPHVAAPAPSAPEVVLAKDAKPTDSANSTPTKQ